MSIGQDRENGDEAVLAGPSLGAAAPMRLRPEPPRVARLSRKVLATLGVAASLGVGTALIYALQARDAGEAQGELYSTENRPTADGLEGLPRDYTGPVLGPPLPGDLGRPILDAQNRGQPVALPPTVATPAVDPEEQRRLAEAEAARVAEIFFQSSTGASASGGAPAGTGGGMLASPDRAGYAGQSGEPIAQDRQLRFLNQTADRRTVAPDRVMAPVSPYVLQAGSVIPAALVTGIRSDLPGQITAQVTQAVYDSPTGRVLLIPQGTRVVGEYDNGVGFGQRRVLLVWNRLIFPNGRSIVLERQPGADAEGYAGLEDGVDRHWWDLAKAAGLSTLLSIGAQAGSSGEESDLVRAIRRGTSDGLTDVGEQVVGRQLDVAPTLTVRLGFPVRVVVTRDLVLEPYGA